MTRARLAVEHAVRRDRHRDEASWAAHLAGEAVLDAARRSGFELPDDASPRWRGLGGAGRPRADVAGPEAAGEVRLLAARPAEPPRRRRGRRRPRGPPTAGGMPPAMPDRLLLGPGPSNPYPEVVAALRPSAPRPPGSGVPRASSTRPATGSAHVFGTANELTLPGQRHRVRGHGGLLRQPRRAGRPGSSGGQRRVRRAHVRGGAPRPAPTVVRVEERLGPPARPAAAARRPARAPEARCVAVVHAETSTGVENTIEPLRALRDTDTLLLVDTVTSLGGIPRRGRRVGDRRGLLGDPEVPGGAARPGAGELLRAGDGAGPGP